MGAPLHQNFFEYQPTKDLNRLLREYGQTCLSDTLPSPPEGMVNINWQTDSMGHISAYVEPGGGGQVNILPKGEWSSSTSYVLNNVVFYNGGSFIALQASTDEVPTDTTFWAPFAAQGPQGEPGDGGVVAGTANQLAFYTSDGLSVQGGANSSAPTFNNANQSDQYDSFWAGTLSIGFPFQHPVTLPSSTFYPNISDYNYFQNWNVLSLNGTIQGSGFSLGNEGGWTVGKGFVTQFNSGVRGIHQSISHIIHKHATGDTAATYGYVFTDGGVSAASDEGVTGTQSELNENFGYYHGTVVSSTGVNDRAPVWSAATSGNNWTTDGAFMLNISRPICTTRCAGSTTDVVFTINGTPTSTYFFQMPTTTGTLPVSTAIGYQFVPNWSSAETYTNREIVLFTDGHVYQSTGNGNLDNTPAIGGTAFWQDAGLESANNWLGIPNQQCTTDSPVPCTFSVALVTFNGNTNGFSVGDHISVAGSNYPEQSVVTAVTTTGSGTNITQRVTCLLRNPNFLVTLFKGGVAGGYISSAANLAFSGMRSSYYAFGSLDGVNLIYGLQVGGGIQFNHLPQAGSEQWAFDGSAEAEFTVYPGAEIVSNPDYYNPAGHIEQNNVPWTAGDLVENPHYPVFGGTAAWFTKQQTTPSNSSHGSSGIQLTVGGGGWAGGNTAHINLINENPVSYYQNGGVAANTLFAPACLQMQGPYSQGVYFSNAPQPLGQATAVIYVANPFVAGNPTPEDVTVIRVAYAGQLDLSPSLGRWSVDGDFQCNTYWTNVGGTIYEGASGTFVSQDSKTVTVHNGLITGIV